MSDTITLRWNASVGASSYHLQLAFDSLFTNLIVNDSTITTTSRFVSGLPPNCAIFWHVKAKNVCGTRGFSTFWFFSNSFVGILKNSNDLPDKFELFQNYPNPFNPTSNIKYQIAKSSFVKMVVYNILGEEVATLVNEKLQPGTYEVEWDASIYPSGVYFYKLETETFSDTKKLILLK